MEEIDFLDLKPNWIKLVSALSDKLESTRSETVACSFNPRWTCATFTIEKNTFTHPEKFPDFGNFSFGTYEFDESISPLDIIYSASEEDGKYCLKVEGEVIPSDEGDHLFNMPILSYAAVWTREYLAKNHSAVKYLYFADSDQVFPCVLKLDGSQENRGYWDPDYYVSGGDVSQYLEKIFS